VLYISDSEFYFDNVNLTGNYRGIEFYPSDISYCEGSMENVFYNDLEIIYGGNEGIEVDGKNLSQLILCNGNGSTIQNSNVTFGGVQLKYTNNSVFSNVIINPVSFSSIDTIGFDLIGSSNNTIEYSNFIGNEKGLSLFNAHYNIFLNNNFTENNNGFYLMEANHNYFEGNIIIMSDSNFGSDSSCPFTYTWNGTNYVFISDMSSEGILGNSYSNNVRPNDYVKVENNQLVPVEDKYTIQITEEYDEIVYMDKLNLVTIDHSSDYNVYNGLTRSDEHTLFTVSKDLQTPISCIDALGNDCLDAISELDKEFTMYPIDDVQNTIEVNLGDLSSFDDIKLVVSYSWANGYYTSSIFKGIQIKNELGEWVTIINGSEITSRAVLQKTYVLNLTDKFITDDYRVRFLFPIQVIDYIGIDTTPQQEFIINTYSPSYADLHYRGYSNYIKNITKTFFYDDLINVDYSNPTGNFTKYGNVIELLEEIDNKFVIMHHGDEITVEYPYIPETEGMERSFFVNSNAYYKHANRSYGDTVEPLPFQEMSMYPYPDEESYPYDELSEYLNEYNTREYVNEENYGASLPVSYNNTITGNTFIGDINTHFYGLYLEEETDTKILNNNISGFNVGINLFISTGTLIDSNNITDVNIGFSLYGSDSNNITNNYITADTGVSFDWSNIILIENNTFTTDYCISYEDCNYVVINNNTFSGYITGGNCISVEDAEGSTINNNTINNFEKGISIYSSINTNILYNLIENISYTNIHNVRGSGSYIFGNTIMMNNSDEVCGPSYDCSAIYVMSDYGENIIVENNNITTINGYGISNDGVDDNNYNEYTNNQINITSTSLANNYYAIHLFYGDNGCAFESILLRNTIYGDYWVNDLCGNNIYNNSYSGNKYYFANGTASWDIYNITDLNEDGWADDGTDYPFNNETLGNSLWNGSSTDWHPAVENEPSVRSITIELITPEDGTIKNSGTIEFKYNVTTGWGEQYIETCAIYLHNDLNLVGLWHLDNSLEDSSLYDSDGTAVGGEFTTNYSKGTHAYSFNGVDEYITTDSASALNIERDMTISAWVYSHDNVNDSIVAGKIYYNNDWDNGGYLLRHMEDAWEFNVANNQWGYIKSDDSIVPNTWQHIVGVYEDGELYLYIDGVLNEETSESGSIPSSIRIVDNNFGIGYVDEKGSLGAEYFDGKIDEVAVWNRALSAEEILEMYENTNNLNRVLYTENHTEVEKNIVNTFSFELPVNNYNWYIECADNYNESSISETRTLIVNQTLISSPSRSSSSKEKLNWDYEFDCETGLIIIKTEKDIEVRLMNVNDYSTYKGTTNSKGLLQFTLTSEGDYKIYTSSTGDYYALSDDFRVTFCKPVEEIPNEEDGGIIVVNETNETEDEIIIPVVEEDQTELEKLILLAENELNNALNQNKDVSDAQQKLKEAKDAFNSGNYELAEQLTNEALEIIYNAEAQIPEKNETGIEGNQTEISTEQTNEGFDWSLFIIGLILLILIYLGYKMLNKSKK
jgi:parallel beta-helix repeat protein